MYHVIHQSTWDYYCLFGVDGKLPTSLKKTDLSNLWKFHIPFSFFSFFASDCTRFIPLFTLLWGVSTTCCTLFSFWSINSSQYHVIVNHVTVCSVLTGKRKRKRKRSDSVLWQKPLHQQKCQKGKVTTQTTPQKSSIKQRLRTDLGRSVGVTTATQLVWLTGLRAHLPTNRNSRLIKRTHV